MPELPGESGSCYALDDQALALWYGNAEHRPSGVRSVVETFIISLASEYIAQSLVF